MTYFFTSDLHLFDKNIIKRASAQSATAYRGRDKEEMIEMLVTAWNSKVGKQDIVWNLGDVSFGKDQETAKVLSRLNGQHNLILGNHDFIIRKPSSQCRARLNAIKDIHDLVIDGSHIVLCHYPMLHWNKQHYGSYHLHGHSHGHLRGKEATNSLDVGVDASPLLNLAPRAWEEIKAEIDARENSV